MITKKAKKAKDFNNKNYKSIQELALDIYDPNCSEWIYNGLIPTHVTILDLLKIDSRLQIVSALKELNNEFSNVYKNDDSFILYNVEIVINSEY